MLQEARRINIPEAGYHGILAMDEMSIQEDLQIDYRGGQSRLVGFVDMGSECADLEVLKSKEKCKLANEVLQVNFLGDTGFRFPVAHFPCSGGTAPEYFVNMWKIVSVLQQYGFQVSAFFMDGSSKNRSFQNMLFPDGDALKEKFSVTNPYNQRPNSIVIMMDPSHQLKKIRNSLLSSKADGSGTRMLRLSVDGAENSYIFWDYWEEAYKWDIDNNIRIHRGLVFEAIYPNSSEKMRNGLANAAIDRDMLFLMQKYQMFLAEHGKYLSATIELLKNTSILVGNFLDKRPIKSLSDVRLQQNKDSFEWFMEWEDRIKSASGLSAGDKNRCLMSQEYIVYYHATHYVPNRSIRTFLEIFVHIVISDFCEIWHPS